MKNSLVKYLVPVLVFVSIQVVLAQTSQQVKDEVDKAWTDWKQILQIILTAAIAIGGVMLAYAYFTNRQESKEHLTKWVIGLIVAALVRAFALS